MNLVFRIGRTLIRRATTTFMDKVGSKVVARMADTSSDAPNAFYEPKRNHRSSDDSTNPDSSP